MEERGERIWEILQMLLWDFPLEELWGLLLMEHQSEWVCARVEVCVLCYNTEVTMTGRQKRKREKKKTGLFI